MKTFLSTPITALQRDMSMNAWRDYCAFVSRLLDGLRFNIGPDVFCALEVEKWGEEVPASENALVRDYAHMKSADLVVCLYWSDVVSSILVELGWAWCLDLPIILAAPSNVRLPTLVEGFAVADRMLIIRDDDVDSLISKVCATAASIRCSRRSDDL